VAKKKSGFLPRVVWSLLGLVLVVPAVGFWIALVKTVRAVPFPGSVLPAALGGVILYLLLHILFKKPMTLYIFGHELTHALAGFLSGYRLDSLFVSGKGGEVVLSDTNVFVVLAPYVVPLYTAGVVGLYALIRCYASLPMPPWWVIFLVSFTLTFHGALTAHALWQDQPDMNHAGLLFSLTFILLGHAVILALFLKVLFPEAVFLKTYAAHGWNDTRWVVEKLVSWFR